MAQPELPYDFTAWRQRLKLERKQAALMLGVSVTHMWKLEREARGANCYVWAAYGIEAHIMKTADAKAKI